MRKLYSRFSLIAPVFLFWAITLSLFDSHLFLAWQLLFFASNTIQGHLMCYTAKQNASRAAGLFFFFWNNLFLDLFLETTSLQKSNCTYSQDVHMATSGACCFDIQNGNCAADTAELWNPQSALDILLCCKADIQNSHRHNPDPHWLACIKTC